MSSVLYEDAHICVIRPLRVNPNLSVHALYAKCTSSLADEVHRQAFTKFRVSAHSQAIETGRWNRGGRGRLPVEERLCECGEVQDEIHVIETCHCPRREDIRRDYGFTTYQELIA